jgi:hypothetical protein
MIEGTILVEPKTLTIFVGSIAPASMSAKKLAGLSIQLFNVPMTDIQIMV